MNCWHLIKEDHPVKHTEHQQTWAVLQNNVEQ